LKVSKVELKATKDSACEVFKTMRFEIRSFKQELGKAKKDSRDSNIEFQRLNRTYQKLLSEDRAGDREHREHLMQLKLKGDKEVVQQKMMLEHERFNLQDTLRRSSAQLDLDTQNQKRNMRTMAVGAKVRVMENSFGGGGGGGISNAFFNNTTQQNLLSQQFSQGPGGSFGGSGTGHQFSQQQQQQPPPQHYSQQQQHQQQYGGHDDEGYDDGEYETSVVPPRHSVSHSRHNNTHYNTNNHQPVGHAGTSSTCCSSAASSSQQW
jgi:hypothetical protein